MTDHQTQILTGKPEIVLLQMRSQLCALGLELIGMRHSSGQSISALIKRVYGIKKRKKVDVYKEFHALILEKETECGITHRALNNSEKRHLCVE